jgi:pyruvate/2-oxoglutarate dehydrogenase complex dihydrolipoamide acyltransferase (E2) component
MLNSFRLINRFTKLLFGTLLLLTALVGSVHAQSIEQENPTPVSASEVVGRIVARDVGDPRLTRHFYILSATQGDLLVTVEGRNLNGDVDLFTASGLRPLAKISMYSGESNTKATKSVFIKQRQQLLLRVEARSANDFEGTYRIRFEGSFEPLSEQVGDSNAPRAPEVSINSSGRSGTRVSSVGARLPEEIRATTSEAKPSETETPPVAVAAEPANSPAPDNNSPSSRAPRRAARRTRSVTPARSRSPRARPSIAKAPEAQAEPAPTIAEAEKAAPATAPPVAAPRLLIEFRSGERIERLMSTVRRVTIDNNQLLIVGKDGRIERRQLSDVLRFSIEP